MSKDIFILGIHDGHNCGATITKNGTVMASICEERLTRRKNEVGFPKLSIHEVMRIVGIDSKDLDEVVFGSLFVHSPSYLKNLEPWYIVGINEQHYEEVKPKDYRNMVFNQRRRERIREAVDCLDVPENNIVFVEHHIAHLAAAYYTNPKMTPGQKILGITCDGSGDGISATVSICRGNTIERIAETSRHCSLGKIYSRVTMLMGMKPWEHEYKLMGLAPYADPVLCHKAAEVLHGLLKIREDGLGFELASELSTNYCYEYLRDAFERVRFDIIAGATQLFTEELLVEFIRECINYTGIRDIVCSGGVFMNVKANMLISEMPEVKTVYVMPSASDESISIGACLYRYYKITNDSNHFQSIFEDLYLGGEFKDADEEKAIQKLVGGKGIEVVRTNDIDTEIVKLLTKGQIVARCRGRMEWGARSLGNRSILASSDEYAVVAKINEMIKLRDFWMPFAPSILEESSSRYFDNPKNLQPYYMTFAVKTKPETYTDLIASSHPKDHTIRPQIVTKRTNSEYHKLLSSFQKETGRGCILNTSFNLHGHPIVYSPEDAIDVFLNSGLFYLALNKYLLSKKPMK